MTLGTGVICMHVVETGRINDGVANRLGDVSAAGTMATLAPDVPFGDGLCRDVLAYGMTPVT
jgi:hypothetical protein